tara:strand:- start:18756 stop:18956 length:201 start_codon:yes stop_codon:yes gene_type:complete
LKTPFLSTYPYSFFRKKSRKSNDVVIMVDDLGYGDVGFNGSTEIPTKNIDGLANQGLQVTVLCYKL